MESDEEDTIGILAAIEDVKLQCVPCTTNDSCHILQANITSYRSEVRQWLVSNQWHMACLQEAHQVAKATEVLSSSLKAVALEPWPIPAEPTLGGSTGGLVSVAYACYQTRLLHKYSEQGKGFVFSAIRFHGWELAVGNIYLESGVGPGGGVNPSLLAALTLFIQELRVPWIVVGDWNCSHDELSSSGFLRLVHGQLIAPLEATTSQGSAIDFGVVCSQLAGGVSVSTEWDVPFKPHAALRFTIRKNGACLPVPQPPKFASEPGANQGSRQTVQVQEVVAMFEEPSSTHQDVHWGRIMATLEETLQMSGKGRGWDFPVKRAPLVLPTAPDKPWQGGRVAYWERIQLWIQQRSERSLTPSQFRLFMSHLKSLEHMLEPEEKGNALLLRTELEAFVIGHPRDLSLVQTIVSKAKQLAQEWRNTLQSQYQQWLQGAVEGGMRGLYKALKKPENVQARPYRQESGELRPHLRRQEWKQVWKPTANNKPEEHPLFAQLKERAASQLQQVGPLTDEQVARALQKMAKKACGPDGLTSQMLKALEPAFRTWESTGIMPEAATMVLVALIPKKETEERPIALTSYAYRAWCKSRYPLHDQWATRYQLTAPWDRAVKNHSSLEVAVTRVMKGEVHRQNQKSGVTLLLDLRGFYENVSHQALITSAFKHGYPPLLLHGAMQLYRGKRHLCAESMVSAPLVATQGILAGCPLAPGLSKLVMHDVVEPIWNGPPKCHVDLYIDDTGFDVVHSSAQQCARMAYQVWQEARRRLGDARLPLSVGKTAWICSNKKVEKALAKLLQDDDPTIRDIHKDLGIDSGWGKRRRIATHRVRMQKGGARKKRLDLLAPEKRPKVRAFKQGVLSVALYGHVALGLAAKRLKWIRHQQAQVLGRMSLGSTEFVLEHANDRHEDPACVIIHQHFRFLHKLLVKWPQENMSELEEAWRFWYNRIMAHKEPWRIVVGPIGAAVCYLKALGWSAASLTVWRGCGKEFCILDRASLHHLSFHLKQTCDQWRWAALARSEEGSNLATGIDWQAPVKARKRLKGLNFSALTAVWQGAIRHGAGAWCARCNKAATLRHVLWDCSWWQQNQQEPSDFPRLRKAHPDASLWLRGLPASMPRPSCYQQQLQETGIFNQDQIEAADLHFATDGSPGGSQDKRFQVATWGVIAFQLVEDQVRVVGTATGPVPCEQTVFRAEAQALVYLVSKVQGNLEVTMDAKSVQQAVHRPQGWKSEDLLQLVRVEQERVHLTWINSHLPREEFVCKFGEDKLWRWQANAHVDQLVQTRANQCRDLDWEQKVLIRDNVALRINALLASRTAALFQYEKNEGPQLTFPEDLKAEKSRLSPAAKQKPKQTKIVKFKSSARISNQAAKPGDTRPNKRRQMERMLDGTGPSLGHTWIVGHKSRDQLTIKCSTCGFYIEQTEKQEVFDRKARHHCAFQGPPFPLQAHSSHRIINGGRAWLCTKCGLKQWVNQEGLAAHFSQECRQRYQGKDPWVKSTIQRALPKMSFFQPKASPPEALHVSGNVTDACELARGSKTSESLYVAAPPAAPTPSTPALPEAKDSLAHSSPERSRQVLFKASGAPAPKSKPKAKAKLSGKSDEKQTRLKF